MRLPFLAPPWQRRPRRPREPLACPHSVIVPRWDEPQDMGKEERASGYVCHACGAHLTLEDAAEARARGLSG